MKKKNYFSLKNAFSALMLFGAFTLNAQTHITDRAGLEAIANDPGGSYVLDNDIDLSGADWVRGDYVFYGTLDGNGHKILNMTINADYPEIGLFKKIANDGDNDGPKTVKNLGFVNININSTSNNVGAIAGTCGPAIFENCWIESGTITTTGDLIGGFSGLTYGITVRKCYSYANVNGKGHVGGLIGHMNGGLIEDCNVNANIKATQIAGGGIAGWEAEIAGEIRRCYAKGTVKVYDIGFGGGIVGVMDDANSDHTLKITDCIAAQSVIQYIDGDGNVSISGCARIYSDAGKGIVTPSNNYGLETIPGEWGSIAADGYDGANMTEAQFIDETFFADNLPSWGIGGFDESAWKMTTKGPMLVGQVDAPATAIRRTLSESKAQVYSSNGKIYVKGAEDNATIRFYNVTGMLLQETTVKSNLETFDFNGFVIIEVASPHARSTYKVCNR